MYNRLSCVDNLTMETKPWLTCNTCGGPRVPSGIFHVCVNLDCVENPSSKAAAADRRATMEAWERDNADDEDEDDE